MSVGINGLNLKSTNLSSDFDFTGKETNKFQQISSYEVQLRNHLRKIDLYSLCLKINKQINSRGKSGREWFSNYRTVENNWKSHSGCRTPHKGIKTSALIFKPENCRPSW